MKIPILPNSWRHIPLRSAGLSVVAVSFYVIIFLYTLKNKIYVTEAVEIHFFKFSIIYNVLFLTAT